MTNRLSVCLSLLCLTRTASAASVATVAEKKPNILYLFADQWRGSATGYAGDPNVKTPNLDRLAAQGLNFKTLFRFARSVRRIAPR